MLSRLSRTGPLIALIAALSSSAPAWAQQKKAPPTKAAPAKPKTPPKPPVDAAPAAPVAPPPEPAAAPANPVSTKGAGGKKGPKPGDDDTNKLLEDAQKAAKAGNWEEAYGLLVKVYKVRPTWRVAADLGRAEVGVEKWKDAADHLQIALRDKPDDLPDADRKVIETAFAQAKTKVGALRVNVAQSGAEIVVGGVVVGTAPLSQPVFVNPGAVLVEARLEGYFGLKATKNVAAGAEESVDFTLHRDGGAGTAPAPPPSGDRLIRGENLIVLITGASVAGIATVLGGVFAVMSNKKNSQSHELEQPTRTCTPIEDCMTQFDALQKQKVTFAGASMWSFIGAGAVLLGTGTFLTIQLLTKPNTGVKSSLVVRPDLVGGSFAVQF